MPFDQRGFYKVTGALLKQHRGRVDMTQEDVANLLEMPRATYANIESGRQRASADVIWRLAIVFGVPIEKLLPEPKERSQEDDANVDTSNQILSLNLTGSTKTI